MQDNGETMKAKRPAEGLLLYAGTNPKFFMEVST
jgi:hypothetical protein